MLPFGLTAVSALAQSDAARILVAGYETFVVHVNAKGNWVLIRLATNAGLTGLGEGSQGSSDGSTLRHLALFADRLKAGVYSILSGFGGPPLRR